MSAKTERFPITEREVSYHEARAGIAARQAAAASGGDPAQLRGLVAAAQAEEEVSPKMVTIGRPRPMLKGKLLRGEDLLVSICLQLHGKAFGADPRAKLVTASDEDRLQRYEAIASLALIFTDPETAFDLLDRACDPECSKDDAEGWKRDFKRAAVSFAGDFTGEEIEIIGNHVVNLARLQGAAEDEPGK